MKLLLPCLTLACAATLLHAEELTDSDRADAIKWLENYKDSYTSGASKRIAAAKGALKRASTDEMAAMELYKAAVKQVQFENNGRSSLEYIEWEKNQKDTFANLGFKAGLKLQCHWMLLNLIMAEAEKNKVEIAFPMAEVSSVFNEIASNPQVIDAQSLIGGPASAIKTFLKVNDMSSKSFSDNPFDLGGLFDKFLLPAIEKTGKIADYRKTWLWRIDLERKIHIDPEALTEKEEESGRGDRGRGSRSGDRPDKKKSSSGIANARAGTLIAGTGNELNNKARLARQAKASQKLSDLRWEMEAACFRMGDQKVALKALKEMILDPTLDPEKVATRLTSLTGLLTIANESTPAVESAGAKKKASSDGIDWSTTEDTAPVPKAPAASKKKAPSSADTPVKDPEPTPPAEPVKEEPAKDSSEGDDWNL